MIKKHVYQRDLNGCAVAGLAMLANVDYFVARRAVFPKIEHVVNRETDLYQDHYDEIPCVDDEELFRGARRLGLKIRHYEVKNLSANDIYYRLKNDALLTMDIGRFGYPGTTHCFAWDAKNKKLWDPAECVRGYLFFDLNFVLNTRAYKIVHVVEIIGRK
jgi:hypothetical protein